MMGFGALFTVLGLAVLAYVLGWLPQNRIGRQARNDIAESALDILKARYARGEITKAEYEQMTNELAV